MSFNIAELGGLEIAIAISEFISIVILISHRKRDISLPFLIAYRLILFVPFLGPFFYVWLSSWPSRSPAHVNGDLAGLGRRYISQQISDSAKGRDTNVPNYHQMRESQRRKEKKERSRARKSWFLKSNKNKTSSEKE